MLTDCLNREINTEILEAHEIRKIRSPKEKK
jgi:hypothetical protein